MGIDFNTEMNFWISCERNSLSLYALKKQIYQGWFINRLYPNISMHLQRMQLLHWLWCQRLQCWCHILSFLGFMLSLTIFSTAYWRNSSITIAKFSKICELTEGLFLYFAGKKFSKTTDRGVALQICLGRPASHKRYCIYSKARWSLKNGNTKKKGLLMVTAVTYI